MAVTHPDALFVLGKALIPLVRVERVADSALPPAVALEIGGEILGGRNVVVCHRPGHRELAGGVAAACKYIHDCVTRLYTGLPGKHYRIGPILPGCGLDDASGIEEHYHLLASGMECLGHIFE